MKIVYVGDNRTRGNYGCRATSTALSQLIGEQNEIVGTIYGTYTNTDTGELVFSKNYPAWLYKKLGVLNNWKYLKKIIYMFNRNKVKGHYFFSKYDFISLDFDKSIENLIKCIPANENLREFDLRQYDFDALVVNGEGSFIFATPAWRECLVESMLMYWSLKMGKKVFYLNGMLSKDPYTKLNMETINVIQNVFEKCEIISVREKYSYEFAQKYFKNINLKFYPDALFSWYKYINDDFQIKNGRYIQGMSGAFNDSFEKLDFTKPYICISGSSAAGTAAKNENEIINVYCNLVNSIKKKFGNKYNIYLIEVCEGDKFLRNVSQKCDVCYISVDTPILSAAKILSNSSIYISGRYHPAILASLGGTPCVFMSSNSHKTKSLQELLEYDDVKEFNVLPSNDEIKEIISLSDKKLKEGVALRNKIKKRCEYLSNLTNEQKDLIK